MGMRIPAKTAKIMGKIMMKVNDNICLFGLNISVQFITSGAPEDI